MKVNCKAVIELGEKPTAAEVLDAMLENPIPKDAVLTETEREVVHAYAFGTSKVTVKVFTWEWETEVEQVD